MKNIRERAKAIAKKLSAIIDVDDELKSEAVARLSHQLAIAEQAQEMLENDGLTIDGKFGPKPHPAINIGYNATALSLRLFNQLDVDKHQKEEFLNLG